MPDRSSNLSGLMADGPVGHVLPVSYGTKAVTLCFDSYPGSPAHLFDLPPNCGIVHMDVEGEGETSFSVGTTGHYDSFFTWNGPGTQKSLDPGSQSRSTYTPIWADGVFPDGTKLRIVYEVRGLPSIPEPNYWESQSQGDEGDDPAFTL